MSEVQRWDVDEYANVMCPHSGGDWVTYEHYKQLEARLKRAEAERDEVVREEIRRKGVEAIRRAAEAAKKDTTGECNRFGGSAVRQCSMCMQQKNIKNQATMCSECELNESI